MNTPSSNPDVCYAIDCVIEAGRHAAERGWTPATGGNFSVRIGDRIAITRTGRDKGRLKVGDVAVVRLADAAGDDLSAEAALHFARYSADPHVGAIFHAHMPLAAVLGRKYANQGQLTLDGWELQKALGVRSHLTAVSVPIFPNDQDMKVLATRAEQELARTSEVWRAPAYLIAGHGINVWGSTPSDARRHLEAFDALFTQYHYWSERGS